MQKSDGTDVNLGSYYTMPAEVAASSLEVKRAWVMGLFAGVTGTGAIELKNVVAEKTEKVYEKLEIHERSPQVYAVVKGNIAVPVAAGLEADAVRFCRVSEGEALVVGRGAYHGGPVALSETANVVVALREGTSTGDTQKRPVSSAVRFNPNEG